MYKLEFWLGAVICWRYFNLKMFIKSTTTPLADNGWG